MWFKSTWCCILVCVVQGTIQETVKPSNDELIITSITRAMFDLENRIHAKLAVSEEKIEALFEKKFTDFFVEKIPSILEEKIRNILEEMIPSILDEDRNSHDACGKMIERTVDKISCTGDFFLLESECFMVVEESMPWHSARVYCHSQGGYLAVPNDLTALYNNLYVKGIAGRSYWLGGNHAELEGNWTWTNGSVINQGWQPGEPNDGDGWGAQDCLVFWSPDGPNSLADYSCVWPLPFICEQF